jgi:hypothetical protein
MTMLCHDQAVAAAASSSNKCSSAAAMEHLPLRQAQLLLQQLLAAQLAHLLQQPQTSDPSSSEATTLLLLQLRPALLAQLLLQPQVSDSFAMP